MNVLRLLATGLLVVGLGSATRGEDKKADTNATKIVGSWEVVKCEGNGPPVGSIMEFAKDGKMKVTHKQDGKDVTGEGTYTIAGDKVNVTTKHEGKEATHTATIKKLTDTEMVAEVEEGKKIEFKRKK